MFQTTIQILRGQLVQHPAPSTDQAGELQTAAVVLAELAHV